MWFFSMSIEIYLLGVLGSPETELKQLVSKAIWPCFGLVGMSIGETVVINDGMGR